MSLPRLREGDLMARCSMLLLLLALCPLARGDAWHAVLDGSDVHNKPADFGYKVETLIIGKKVTVTLRLNEDAVKAFESARVNLRFRGRQVLYSPLKLERAAGGKGGVIRLVFDRAAVDEGHITISSGEIKGQPLRVNFGGFHLFIPNLLKHGVKVEPD
jgi:hypothetical protein